MLAHSSVRLRVGAIASYLVVCAPLAEAQTLRGVVLDDSTGVALSEATILLSSGGRAVPGRSIRSDSAGRFVIHAPAPGWYSLRSTRIGYAAVSSDSMRLAVGQVATLTLRMSAVSQRLGTVIVVDTRRLNGYELMSDLGFELRRNRGNGTFLDTAILRDYKNHPAHLLLTDHAGTGVRFEAPPPRKALAANVDRLVMLQGLNPNGSLRTCDPEMWIDGFPATQAKLRTYTAADLFGIEVFSRHQIPAPSIAGDLGARQAVLPTRNKCGVIVVWSKNYINEVKKKAGRG